MASFELASKSTLRDRFRAFRRGLSEDEWAERSAAIRARVRSLPELSAVSTVHGYWPQTEHHEVDTRPLIRDLHADGVTVALPVVTAYPPARPEMAPRRFTGTEALTPNRWDILEPTDAPPVDVDALELVLVPALGAGRKGHRIGHGTGYYDAFLASVRAPTVALVYEATLVDALPADPHDQPVDVVVTETAVVRP